MSLLQDCERFLSLLGSVEKVSAKSVRARLVHPNGCTAVVKAKLSAGKLEVTWRKGDALVYALARKQLDKFLAGEALLWHAHQILGPPPPPRLEEYQCARE